MSKPDKPEKILATALKLFVEYGFHGTPTSRIASEAGVANGTLFHYFKTKDELVVALYMSIKDELNRFLADKMGESATPKEKFRTLFRYTVEWGLANNDAFYFLQQVQFSPHKSLLPESWNQTEVHTQLLQETAKTILLKPLPLDLIRALFSNQIDGLYQYLIKKPLSSTEQQYLLNDVFELTWTMIANPEAP
ncbi:TetR/AcrR family transcriptional regulator [Larkinella ripae]